jgi:rhodanese-related sulfurtransferase
LTRRLLAISLGVALTSPAFAADDYYLLNAEQVQAWVKQKPKAVVVDSRTPPEFEQAHLPGAINIPTDRLKQDAARLPADRAARLIFYCRGMGCTLSPAAARIAAELGYTHVGVYQAGIPDWLLKGLPIEKGPEPAAAARR